MPLNDRQIKNAKPTGTGKKSKLFDGSGLYLEITPAGGKIFRLKYRIDGKEKTLTIGKYPAVSLSEARQAAENARHLLSGGQDPAAAKQQAKQERQAALLNTFAATTRRWHTDNLHRWKPNHAERIMRYFETDVFPLIGEIPIDSITVGQIK
ncbi:integrase [Eikenella sp. NML080894]|uniref:tyrosine-type recombinase/integrase n=1 Tax=unclassified Eikenella TaxID=2639367 RepID=UPI0007E0E763|nr:integrase [Eikenella sp. NML080894]OAM38207.1 integrase [Eikenella sp. NML120348]OAM45192.1 integrase [Eikenella sp. NML99-0057]